MVVIFGENTLESEEVLVHTVEASCKEPVHEEFDLEGGPSVILVILDVLIPTIPELGVVQEVEDDGEVPVASDDVLQPVCEDSEEAWILLELSAQQLCDKANNMGDVDHIIEVIDVKIWVSNNI